MIRSSLIVCLAVGAAGFGALLIGQVRPGAAIAATAEEAPASDTARELDELQARLAMVMADYHATNLWFAGRNANWPLADYYWKEVESHIKLSERPAGAVFDDTSSRQLVAAIEKRDPRAFNTAYQNLLVSCYDCHKAVGRPYLRPRMPARPSRSIINVDPKATWPE